MAKFNAKFVKKIMGKIKKSYLWVLSVLAICAVAGIVYTSYANPSDNLYTIFDIGLPTKVDGIEKLEYRTDGNAQGSVDGHVNSKFSFGTRVSFLIKFNKEGYKNLLANNVKVVSDKGTSLGLKTFEEKSWGLGTNKISDSETIDPNQTYVTEAFTVCQNESFKIEGVNLDEFDLSLKLDRSMYSMEEALNVGYEVKQGERNNAVYNEEKNNYTIKNIKHGSNLKLFVETTEGFSNSKLKFTNDGVNITKSDMDNSLCVYNLKKDTEVVISGLNKNTYKLEFTNYNDVLFKYRKDHSDNEFKELDSKSFTVTYGDNYDFVCKPKDDDVLDNKEIAINGIAVSANNGVYHIDSIKQDNVVSIKNKQEVLYPIDLSENKVTLIDKNDGKIENATVNYGENFEFKIFPTDGYTQNVDTARIYAVPTSKLSSVTDNSIENYNLIPAQEYLYTISEVKEPMTLIVKNLKKNEYIVEMPEVVKNASYVVEESEVVKKLDNFKYRVVHGESIKIKVTADEYKSLEKLSVGCSDKNTKVSSNNGVYTISNITRDSYVAINNVTDLKYNVKFGGEGFRCYNEKGMIYTDNKSEIVCKNGKLKFKAKLNSGYKKENGKIEAVIKSGKAKLNKIDDEYYELTDVFSDVEINFEGISKISESDLSKNLETDNIEDHSVTSAILKSASSLVLNPKTFNQEDAIKPLDPKFSTSPEVMQTGYYISTKIADTIYFDTKNLDSVSNKVCEINSVNGSTSKAENGLIYFSPSYTVTPTLTYFFNINISGKEYLKNLNFKIYVDSNYKDKDNLENYNKGDLTAYKGGGIFYFGGCNIGYELNDNGNYIVSVKFQIGNALLSNLVCFEKLYVVAEYEPKEQSEFVFDTNIMGSDIIKEVTYENKSIKNDDDEYRWSKDFSFKLGGSYTFDITTDHKVDDVILYRNGNEISNDPAIERCTAKLVDHNNQYNEYKYEVILKLKDGISVKSLGELHFVLQIDESKLFGMGTIIFSTQTNCLSGVNFYNEERLPTGIDEKGYAYPPTEYRYNLSKNMLNDGEISLRFKLYSDSHKFNFLKVRYGSFFFGFGVTNLSKFKELNKKDYKFEFIKSDREDNCDEGTLTFQYNDNLKGKDICVYLYEESVSELTTINFVGFSEGFKFYGGVNYENGKITNMGNPYEYNSQSNTSAPSGEISNNSEYYFVIELKKGYEIKDGEKLVSRLLTARDKNLGYVSDKFEKVEVKNPNSNIHCYKLSDFRNVKEVNVTINGIEKKKYEIKFDKDKKGSVYTREDGKSNDDPIEHGGSLSFTVSPDVGYADDMLSFKINNVDMLIENGNKEQSFTIKVDDEDSIEVYAKMEDGKFSYTVKNIVDNLTISSTRELKKQTLTFNKGDGMHYEFFKPASLKLNESDQAKIRYGYSVSFMVKSEEGYDVSDVKVYCNNILLDPLNGVYNLSNITEDLSIRVENVTKLKNKATFSMRNGIIFKDESGKNISDDYREVEYGEPIKFKVVREKGYTDSDIIVNAEFADGKTFYRKISKDGLEAQDDSGVQSDKIIKDDNFSYDKTTGVFTIQKLTQNVRIYVTETNLNICKIYFPENEKIEYKDQYGSENLNLDEETDTNGGNKKRYYEVSYGDSMSFRIAAKDGSADLSELKIYKNSTLKGDKLEILPVNDVYIVENVTEDINIVVEDIKTTKCNVEFHTVEGVKCVDINTGKDIGQNISVDYGDNFKFKLSLDSAYSHANPTVTVKGANEPLANAGGIYTLSNITENKIVEILDVKKNTYKVKFEKAEGVEYKNGKNKVFEGEQEIEYDGVLYFKVSLLDAYDESTPWVLLNNEKTLSESGGIYKLENIKDNATIVVKNVAKNKEEVTMDNINNVPQDIASENDIDSVVKATQAYDSLSDEDKQKVTNLEQLKSAQKKAGVMNHKSGGVEVSGIDWNAKVYITPLNDNLEQMKKFDEKVDRRTVLSLYEIKLVDVLTGKAYEVEYGKTVSVTIPSVDLFGYKNIVVVHEKNTGSIEYLDASISPDVIQFETTSFSKFAVAAKEIPNYSEGTSNLQISVSELVKDDKELTTLLGENVSSQLGSLIDKEDIGLVEDSGSDTGNEIIDSISNAAGEAQKAANESIDYAYNWALENEFLAVIIILIVGSILIGIIFYIGRKRSKDDENNA